MAPFGAMPAREGRGGAIRGAHVDEHILIIVGFRAGEAYPGSVNYALGRLGRILQFFAVFENVNGFDHHRPKARCGLHPRLDGGATRQRIVNFIRHRETPRAHGCSRPDGGTAALN